MPFRKFQFPATPASFPPQLRWYIQKLVDELGLVLNIPILLNDLGDVIITSAASGDTIRFDGTNWINSAFLRNTGAAVIIGTDPGGSDIFRIGSSFRAQGSGSIVASLISNNSSAALVLSSDTGSTTSVSLGHLSVAEWVLNALSISEVRFTDGAGNIVWAADAAEKMGIGGLPGANRLKVYGSADIDSHANINGLTYTWPAAHGAGNRVLQNNGAGALSWVVGGGGGGPPAWTAFTKDLGAARRSGTFDITGLAGLTPNTVVDIVQTAAPIASKGNARDEFEMDLIELTGYVFDASTIRAYWHAPSVVVGTYEFAYIVGG